MLHNKDVRKKILNTLLHQIEVDLIPRNDFRFLSVMQFRPVGGGTAWRCLSVLCFFLCY